MNIDTHQHFWKLDRGDYDWLTPDLTPLYQDFLPQDLEPILAQHAVDGTIAVQAAATEAETEYLLWLADRFDWILGVVGWVDLAAPHACNSIARLAEHPKLVGLRPMIQDIPEDDWMLGEALAPAIAAMVASDLTFDALVMPRHLENLDRFLGRYPALRVVVDHCAKPEIRHRQWEPWAADLAKIARHQNTFCKVSGLTTEAGDIWSDADLAPYLGQVAKVFGPQRLLFGSDWPVLNIASDYGDWHQLISSSATDILQGSTPQTMAQNAQKAYPRLRV